MKQPKDARWIRALLMTFLLGGLLELLAASVAEARAGSRRSMGKRSKPQPTQPYQADKQQPPAPKSGGSSLMKGLAAGVAGGFLGSMLFSSLGMASDTDDATGGIGLLEIVLLLGGAYLIFRWWKKRQLQAAYGGSAPYAQYNPGMQQKVSYPAPTQPSMTGQSFPAAPAPWSPVASLKAIEPKVAEHIFLEIQKAWSLRDLGPARALLSAEMATELEHDLDFLRQNRLTNRVEQISFHQVAVGEPWSEDGADLNEVRFRAQLLDYTIDDATGHVREGHTNQTVWFEEIWIFRREVSQSQWRLVGIQQV